MAAKHDDLEGLRGAERRELLRRLACLHLGIAWRALRPRKGRLHATCPHCGADVSRPAFPKE